MEFDYSELRGRIIAKFGTIKAFAKAYGISYVTMSNKLNGKIAISMDDIVKMSAPKLLDILPIDYHIYFFKLKVHKERT